MQRLKSFMFVFVVILVPCVAFADGVNSGPPGGGSNPDTSYEIWGGSGTELDPFWYEEWIEGASSGWGVTRYQDLSESDTYYDNFGTELPSHHGASSHLASSDKEQYFRRYDLEAFNPGPLINGRARKIDHQGSGASLSIALLREAGSCGREDKSFGVIHDDIDVYSDSAVAANQDHDFYNQTELYWHSANMGPCRKLAQGFVIITVSDITAAPLETNRFDYLYDIDADNWSYSAEQKIGNPPPPGPGWTDSASGDFSDTQISLNWPQSYSSDATWWWNVTSIEQVADHVFDSTAGPYFSFTEWTPAQIFEPRPAP